MRTGLRFSTALAVFLVALSGCDTYSLLDGYNRTGGLSLTASSSSLEQDGTTGLYATGGKEPYSWMLVENDLAYIDPVNRLGTVESSVYSAGNSIGTVTVRIRDSMGNIENAEIIVVPLPPTGLYITNFVSKELKLNWSFAHPSHLSGYTVYRSKEGAPFIEVTTLGSGCTNFTDTGLSKNTDYSYYLQAINGKYRSKPTTYVTKQTN